MEKSESTSSDSGGPCPWHSYNTVYTNAKAGMEGVDKEKVQRIVYETSKGSKYFENEERKQALIRQKIDKMRARCAGLTPAQLSHYQKVSDKMIVELDATRDLSKIWLHVDMDAFYAAVETLTDPSLKGKPMAVGSLSMISTANYEARRYGVRAAMPGFIALKLCPELIFVPTDFKKYMYYSDLTRKVFQKYDPNFMAASLDEAYLDITEVCYERGVTGEEIARELRASVYEETGLTCSAGVAPNRLLAKVCSDINKPNGQFVLANDRMAVVTFISSLPIRKIGGIGKVTEHILGDVFGINTCGELLQKGNYLCALFSQSTADFFLSVGLGIGKTDTPKVQQRKSISNERTFSATENETLLYQKLVELAELLSDDMRKEGLQARTLTLKLKTASFEVCTRAVTLPKYICSTEEILKHASKLLKAELPVSLRLMGLRASQFKEDNLGPPEPTQQTLANFILGNSSRKVRADPSSSGSLCTNLCPINDLENDSSIDSCQTTHLELQNPLDRLETPDLDDSCPMTKVHGDSLGGASACEDKVTAAHFKVSCKTFQNDKSSDFLSSDATLVNQFGMTNSLDDANSKENMVHDEEPSLKQQEQVIWLHDYKCSICGIELPPCFIEERQEHSDFHLAERLQKEEHVFTSRMQRRQRFHEEDQSASHSKRKKQKLSLKGSGHLPINLFFEKKCENS